MLAHEICEEEAALASREVPLVQHESSRFHADPTREEDLQLSLLVPLLTRILPGSSALRPASP
jgi:hypothetical protein